jgi:hypothetical protein
LKSGEQNTFPHGKSKENAILSEPASADRIVSIIAITVSLI